MKIRAPFYAVLVLLGAAVEGMTNSVPADDGTVTEKLIETIDRCVPGSIRRYNAAGVAIALVRKGKVVWAQGYGTADEETGKSVTPSTVFQAASISKPVTAWAVMTLVDAGILDLDAPVETYLRRWHLPPSSNNADGVTIRRILSHTAGLSLGGFRGYSPDVGIPSLPEALSGKNSGAGDVRIIREPGGQFAYSGGGYALLSLVIEDVTGRSFETYIREEVLLPLGMKLSGYALTDSLRAGLAVGYDRTGTPLPNFLFAVKGAASLYTTAVDLARFVAAGMPGPASAMRGRGVISPRTVELMCRPVASMSGDVGLFFDTMGLGYFLDDKGFVSHTGSNRGWRNMFTCFPGTGDGIVVLTNSDRGRNVYVEILDRWSETLFGESPKICGFFTAVCRISGTVAAVLLISLLVCWGRMLLTGYFRERMPIRRVGSLSRVTIAARVLFMQILPPLLLMCWVRTFNPLLADLSPLTAPWVNAGMGGWVLTVFVRGFFPKPVPAA